MFKTKATAVHKTATCIFIHYLSESNYAKLLKGFSLLPCATKDIGWDCSFKSNWTFSQLSDGKKEEEMKEKKPKTCQNH